MKIANLISRIVIGVVFIFSGFVKAIDPLGSVYKFNDYFNLAFNVPWMESLSLPLAFSMSAIEFLVGFAVLFGLRYKLSSLGALLFMLFFTPLTLYIAVKNPVSDCGCFGDALILSNWDTFYKNIFIFAASLIIFLYRNKFKSPLSGKLQWIIVLIATVFIMGISVYSYRHEPIIDFRPWKVGSNIIEKRKNIQEEELKYYLVYKNKKTAEEKAYAIDSLPFNDSVWMSEWEFVKQDNKVIKDLIPAPINNFFIIDEDTDEITDEIISNPDYHFMLVAYDLTATNKGAFEKINKFAHNAEKDNFKFIALTATPFDYIDTFRHEVQAAYPFYIVDEIALKTIIRSNPGIVLFKDGVVIAKWSHRDVPDYQKVKEKFMK